MGIYRVCCLADVRDYLRDRGGRLVTFETIYQYGGIEALCTWWGGPSVSDVARELVCDFGSDSFFLGFEYRRRDGRGWAFWQTLKIAFEVLCTGKLDRV